MIKLLLILITIQLTRISCESGYDAWLRYPPIPTPQVELYKVIPETMVTLTDSPVITSSVSELTLGLNGLLGLHLTHLTAIPPNTPSIILSTVEAIKPHIPVQYLPIGLTRDGYNIREVPINGTKHIVVIGLSDAGVLYGTFGLLRHLSLYKPIDGIDITQNPSAPVRYANEWDNLDGSIERGFAGKSIFFADNNVVTDLTRAEAYARLLASVGVNGCAVNNVNANTRVIESEFLPQLKGLADVLRRWAVRVVLSVDFGSPQSVGGLTTYDPLDSKVIEFWTNKTKEIYKYVPDLAGYVLKADAEGRPGPSKYHRLVDRDCMGLYIYRICLYILLKILL